MKPTTWLPILLWGLCVAYAGSFADRGWIPHDEGTIAQSAERVLRGELPHRDFDELYTGGLSFLHAAAMKLLGVDLLSARKLLFAAFMVFLAVVHAVARRIAPGPAALLAMPLVTAWSVPNYFVSLPSWYNLFLATAGIWALMRYLERPGRAWLLLAGACGGLSMLAKITGAYYVLGGVLFLGYVGQLRAETDSSSRRSPIWLVWLVPLVLLATLFSLEPTLSASVAYLPLFIAPGLVCGFTAWNEWRTSGAGLARLRRLAALQWPFCAGVALAVFPYLLLYWWQGALGDLAHGVLIQPRPRLTEAGIPPPALSTIGLAVPYGVLLLLGNEGRIRRESLAAIALGVVLTVVLALEERDVVYQATWSLVRTLPLVTALGGIVLIGFLSSTSATESTRARVFLLITMGAMVGLVQFPYASPTYFFYVAPLIILGLLAIVAAQAAAPRRLHLLVAAFLFLFAVVFTNRTYGWNLGARFIAYAPDAQLALPRGQITVSRDDAELYKALVETIQSHAAGGTIYAAPDCPEVYFLSGFPNPSRSIFDFLSRERQDAAWMTALLARAPVRVAVINTAPEVSPPLMPAVRSVLEQRFPQSQQFGRFIVRW